MSCLKRLSTSLLEQRIQLWVVLYVNALRSGDPVRRRRYELILDAMSFELARRCQ